MLDREKSLKVLKAMSAKKKDYSYAEVEKLVPDMIAKDVSDTLLALERNGFLRARGKDKSKEVHLSGPYEELAEEIEKLTAP